MDDFLVIGGGVIGLLTARELAHAGARVTVIEQGLCCQEASWAGGGIVSPLYPWRYSAPVTALASAAQRAYPLLCAKLLEETGIDAELEQTGLLMLDAADESEAFEWARDNGKIVEKLNSTAINKKEPGLSLKFSSGLWMPEIANVRNPRLGKALLASLHEHPNATIHEHTRAERFITGGTHIKAVEVSHRGGSLKLVASQYVITTGAWTGGILADLDVHLPVVPVKGQMLLFHPPRRLVNSIVLTEGRYVIPRRDNHLLVGSTLEPGSFDKEITETARHSLLSSAHALLPELATLKVKQQWAGLRPGAPDGIPYIGPVQQFDNLHVNAGQYRNGLVLAPASATLMADLLLGRPTAVDPAPYQPSREMA